MQDWLWVLVLVIISGLTFLLGFYMNRLKSKTFLALEKQENETLKHRLKQVQEESANFKTKIEQTLKELETKNQTLFSEKTKLNAEKENLQLKIQEQKDEVLKLQEQARKDFELLANKILDDKSQKFTQQNKLNLEQVLNPLKEKIKDFETKIETSHKESIEKHASLKQHIESLSKLNQQITKETINLTNALKSDTKMQGNWGELVLDRVLEKSGLEEGREYEKQQTLSTEEGKMFRPDVVIHLPNHRKMIVDSKVSLTAYERYINAENQEEQEDALRLHLLSIQTHIKQLSEKNYHSFIQESPDFVLMFIPIEPAFAVALNQDNELYNKAFEKNIIIVTPTTLLATLRTVDSWWNNDKQQQNAIEIATQAGNLYDKFVGLVTDLTRVGKKMDEAKNEYGLAMNKLVEGKGNVIKRIENIKKMGAKASKSLPEKLIERAEEN